MIQHTVIFSLKHPAGSPEEKLFLKNARVLIDIPGVEQFEFRKQISPKNDYDFGFSMFFADETAYRSYNEHPAHQQFVNEKWIPEVARFLEIDYLKAELPV